MAKWKETHPYFPPTAIVPRMSLMERFPIIINFAVLKEIDGASCLVRCGCGKEFEYVQDQVQCPQCLRHFDKDEAEDMTQSTKK